MSKNKLHTLSKYEADRLNRIAFMPKEKNAHFFDPGGSLFKATSNILSGYNVSYDPNHSNGNIDDSPYTPANTFLSWDKNHEVSSDKARAFNSSFHKISSAPKASFYNGPSVKIPLTLPKIDDDTEIVPFKKAFGKEALKSAGKTMLNAGIGIAGHLVGQGAKAAISGGRSSDIGNGISSLGSTVGGAVGMANPLLGAAITAGSGVLGGLWNGAFGAKWNKENIADVENNIAQMRATDLSSVNSNAALLDAWGRVNLGYDFDQDYIGKNGWLNHKATRKYNKLNAMQKAARAYVQHQLGVAADQADSTQDDLAQSAFIYSDGGFLDNILNSDMGSGTKYLLASNDLDIKRQNADTKAKMASMYAGTPGTLFDNGGPITAFNPYCGGGKLFALGGDYQTNGADFSTGLTHIDAGLSHEMNPNEGVQVGVDSEGIPNLVEEGEVIWNDYVFSNRIQMDNESKEAFHINKKRDITYADEAKKLEKEVKERPNDPISKAAFNVQMEKLQEQQERQKAEMEAKRAQEAFAALSPEEQTAVMQQVAQQEQAAQEVAMQEQAMAQQPMTLEEAAMMQQQMGIPQEQTVQPQVMEPQAIEQPVMAYGGNLFPDGGALKKLIYRLTNSITEGDFAKWAKANNINTELDWNDILQDAAFRTAIAKSNPALAHAMNNNYDFGVYSPDNIEKATIKSIAKGNWTNRLYSGWKGSEDPAWLELIESWKKNLGDNWEQIVSKYDDKKIAEDFKKTSSYQNTNRWLQKDPENMRKYLWEVVSNLDSPPKAVKYAKQFIDDKGNWINNKIPTYAQVFGENGKGVRETFPGTYWHSVVEANRGNVAKNFVINDDGTIEEIVGDTPSDWKLSNTYDWDDPSNHNTYNYYKRAAAEAAKEDSPATDTASKTEEQPVKKKYKPVLLPETKMGLFGPPTALAMMAANIGRPRFAGINKAKAIMDRSTNLATYQPVPGYLTYKPADIWAAEIVNNASARASDRAIANANPMAAIAGHVANNYANQIANNDLYTKGLAYNDNERKTVFDANAGINMQNANAFNQLSQFNAGQLNEDKQRRAYLTANIEAQKLDADASWYNNLYGNVGAMFKGIGDYEREVRDRNTMAKMVASGIYPVNLENALYAGLLEEVAAEGGKLKRKKNKKRGLTI